MAATKSQDEYARTALRLPKDLHQAVHEAAKAQDRSFNGQIIAVLRAAMNAGRAQGAVQ